MDFKLKKAIDKQTGKIIYKREGMTDVFNLVNQKWSSFFAKVISEYIDENYPEYSSEEKRLCYKRIQDAAGKKTNRKYFTDTPGPLNTGKSRMYTVNKLHPMYKIYKKFLDSNKLKAV